MFTGSDGNLILRGNFLHNAKIEISDQVQQKEREKNRSFRHPQGCIISINEIRHYICKYSEVFTKNLGFIDVQITSLETRTGRALRITADKGNSLQNNNVRNNNEDRIKYMNSLREAFSVCLQFISHHIDAYQDIELNRRSWNLDKITPFSLQPPGLLAIDMVVNHNRYFYVACKPLKDDVASKVLNIDMKKSAWTDGVNVKY